MVLGEEAPLRLAHLSAPDLNGLSWGLVCGGGLLGCTRDSGKRCRGDSLARRTNRDTQIPHFTVLDVIDPSVNENVACRSTFTGATLDGARAISGEQGVVLRSKE